MCCRLLPGVEDVAQNVADPECRSVASKAHATLLKVGADGKVTGIVANEAEVLAQLGSAVANAGAQVAEIPTKYAASMICGLINASQYKEAQWFEVSFCSFCSSGHACSAIQTLAGLFWNAAGVHILACSGSSCFACCLFCSLCLSFDVMCF